jgi:hypothetical protein
MIKSIFLSQILANELHELQTKFVLPFALKNKVKNLKPDLIRFSESHFDLADEKANSEMMTIYNAMDNFINEISKVEVQDMPAIVYIYQAYKKDPQSLNGIVNKILK